MKNYLVQVSEVLCRTYIVKANNALEAVKITEDSYVNGDIILDAEEDYCEDSGYIDTVGVAYEEDEEYFEKLNF